MITEEQFEKEFKRLKEINKNLILALREIKGDRGSWMEYEKAVQEYNNAKDKLFKKLQE